MKRSSSNYLRYLEALAKALLAERGHEGDVVGESGETYSPYNVRELVAKMEAQVATIEWAGVVEGHGFGVRVPLLFAQQTSPGTWVKIQGEGELEVRENVATPEGPCLILSVNFGTTVKRSLKAGLEIRLD